MAVYPETLAFAATEVVTKAAELASAIEAARMLVVSAALEAHGPTVKVSLHDLTDVIREAEGFIGGKDNPAFSRLAAAAGVE
jgi:hypothetical protein